MSETNRASGTLGTMNTPLSDGGVGAGRPAEMVPVEKALNGAFEARVSELFRGLCLSIENGPEGAGLGVRAPAWATFDAGLKAARAAYSEAILRANKADEAPTGPETDEAYRARLLSVAPVNDSRRVDILRSDGVRLDSVGGRYKTNRYPDPSAPKTEEQKIEQQAAV